MNKGSITLLLDATAIGSGHKVTPGVPLRTFQAHGLTTAGAGDAQVIFEGTNILNPATDADWHEVGRVDLVLAVTRASGGFVSNAPWTHVRARLASINGTNAKVSALMGI